MIDNKINITQMLDGAFDEVVTPQDGQINTTIPEELLARLQSWEYGKYGHTSTVNLMVTASWYKWLSPEQDVCKIWSRDHNKKTIEGGYGIRSVDEKYTVPLVNKTRIAEGFCSPNSGMQGSRAIEKMRGSLRIGRNTPIEQAVSFDMSLFQNIMNDINECNSAQAKAVFQFFIKKGLIIKLARESAHKKLSKATIEDASTVVSKLISFVEKIGDPQFIKCVTLSSMNLYLLSLCREQKLQLEGIEGSKTAADARSSDSGDFWFSKDGGDPFVAVEVKDSSKTIGFDVLSAVHSRYKNNPSLEYYFLITAATIAVDPSVLADKYWQKMLDEYRDHNLHVLIFTLQDFISLASMDDCFSTHITDEVSENLKVVSDLKRDTIDKWLEFIASL